MMFKYFTFFIIAAVAIAYSAYKLSGGTTDENILKDVIQKKALVREFNDSYPAEIEKTGKVVEYDLVASLTEINFLDDKITEVWAYNKQVPGPTLKVKLGDTLRVNFTNDLPQGTTIHWHGVRVPNIMDGVPGVTQDLIMPGETFVYEFTPKDAGTFWFHPHNRSSEQIERGLYGILIVEELEPREYDQDLTLVIDDWRIDKNGQIDDRFNTTHDLMHDGRWGNILTTNSSVNPKFLVSRGERIRLRLINVSNARVYRPNLRGLDAKVIAVDGMEVKENFSLDNLDLSPGNRIDLDVIISKDISSNQVELLDYFTRNTYKLATFNIVDELVDTPDFILSQNNNIPEWNDAFDLEPDLILNLDAVRQGMQIKWAINGKVYPNIEIINLEAGTFNKILINNQSSRLHPMHLHGQFFKVLSRNGQKVDEDYWRDTVLVKSKESVEIGLVALDKGSWANHCHALEHAEAGMMTIIEVK